MAVPAFMRPVEGFAAIITALEAAVRKCLRLRFDSIGSSPGEMAGAVQARILGPLL